MSEIDLHIQKSLIINNNNSFNVPVCPIISNALEGLASTKNMCESNAAVIKKFAPWSKLFKEIKELDYTKQSIH